MESSKNRRDIFYLILLVLTLITMLVGITFTYFSLLSSEKEDSTRIKTGTISINYVDGREINTYLLLPIDEPNLDIKYSVYKKMFTVSSSGTLDQNIYLYIGGNNVSGFEVDEKYYSITSDEYYVLDAGIKNEGDVKVKIYFDDTANSSIKFYAYSIDDLKIALNRVEEFVKTLKK